MSKQYDLYLEEHKLNVKKGYYWLLENLPELFKDWRTCHMEDQINKHDDSKTQLDEYMAYDAYFYGNNRSYQVMEDFNKAWLFHIHRNPHHWQYWVLINDNPDEGTLILDMPEKCMIEMICDWWAFSWAKGNLYEIFKWYDEHKDYMKLSEKTRTFVETTLGYMKSKLDESEE